MSQEGSDPVSACRRPLQQPLPCPQPPQYIQQPSLQELPLGDPRSSLPRLAQRGLLHLHCGDFSTLLDTLEVSRVVFDHKRLYSTVNFDESTIRLETWVFEILPANVHVVDLVDGSLDLLLQITDVEVLQRRGSEFNAQYSHRAPGLQTSVQTGVNGCARLTAISGHTAAECPSKAASKQALAKSRSQ